MKETEQSERPINVRTETAYETYGDRYFFRIPPSVLSQVDGYRLKREPERQRLIQQLVDYDKATRKYEIDILQVYEMSLQSRSRAWTLRENNRNDERER